MQEVVAEPIPEAERDLAQAEHELARASDPWDGTAHKLALARRDDAQAVLELLREGFPESSMAVSHRLLVELKEVAEAVYELECRK